MKSILSFALMIFITGLSQTSAQSLVYDANAQVRSVETFQGIDVSGGITLYLSQGKETAVAVSAGDDKDVSKIKTEVENGTLKIYIDPGFWNGWNWGNKKLKAYVTIADLETLSLSGGSVGKIEDQITIHDLKLDLRGGSILEGRFQGEKLSMDLNGGSIAKLSGSIHQAVTTASGGSILKSFDLAVDTIRIGASGGSILAMTVNNVMDITASGGSIVQYKGNGVIKSVDMSGGSIIKKKGTTD